jgi:hypothetical protein
MSANECYAGLSVNWPNSLAALRPILPAHHRPLTPKPQHQPTSQKIAAVDLKKSPRLGSDMCWVGLAAFQCAAPFVQCLGLSHDISFVGSCFSRFVSCCCCFVSLYVIGPRIPSLLLLLVGLPGFSGLFMFNTFILFNAFLVHRLSDRGSVNTSESSSLRSKTRSIGAGEEVWKLHLIPANMYSFFPR